MKPFDATYYVNTNRKRATALILMISAIVIIYLGGIYISSVEHMNLYMNKHYNDYTHINRNYGCTDVEYETLLNEFSNSSSIGQVLPIGGGFYFSGINELNIQISFDSVIFSTEEDFQSFMKAIHPQMNYNLKNYELIISSKLAKNCGLKAGDILDFEQDYKIAAVFDSDEFCAYGIIEEPTYNYIAVRPTYEGQSKNSVDEEFTNFLEQYRGNEKITIHTFESIMTEMRSQFEFIDLLYIGIVCLLVIILSITVNATFYGAYEKRHFEFSIYKAIGFSKSAITRKIVKEVILINGFGILLASIFTLTITWLANHFYYYSKGLFLDYFHVESLIWALTCDLLIIIPVALLRVHKIKNYDITEY